MTLLAAASIVQAQTASRPSSRPDPLDPQAQVPAMGYRSSLAQYRRLGDDERTPWTQANETVNRIGGWRAYARQAQQPEPAASAPARSAPATTAATPGATPAARHHHGSHKTP